MNSDPFAPVLKICGVLADLSKSWYVAGGWAIDLCLQKRRRNHKDVDIAVFREDQLAAQDYLIERGWKLSKYVGNTVSLEKMQASQLLYLPDRGIRAEPASTELPTMDILLSETTEGPGPPAYGAQRNPGEWWYHANSQITHPLRTIGFSTTIGVPILSPEIVLLFKATHLYGQDADAIRRWQVDDNDFRDIRGLLTPDQRIWLRRAIAQLYPHHPWLGQLVQGSE